MFWQKASSFFWQAGVGGGGGGALVDSAGAERRLRTFLIYRFGGPHTYLEERGHPRLRMRHAPFAVDARARDRWMSLMMAAVDEVVVAQEHRDYLETFLGDIATFLRNR